MNRRIKIALLLCFSLICCSMIWSSIARAIVIPSYTSAKAACQDYIKTHAEGKYAGGTCANDKDNPFGINAYFWGQSDSTSGWIKTMWWKFKVVPHEKPERKTTFSIVEVQPPGPYPNDAQALRVGTANNTVRGSSQTFHLITNPSSILGTRSQIDNDIFNTYYRPLVGNDIVTCDQTNFPFLTQCTFVFSATASGGSISVTSGADKPTSTDTNEIDDVPGDQVPACAQLCKNKLGAYFNPATKYTCTCNQCALKPGYWRSTDSDPYQHIASCRQFEADGESVDTFTGIPGTLCNKPNVPSCQCNNAQWEYGSDVRFSNCMGISGTHTLTDVSPISGSPEYSNKCKALADSTPGYTGGTCTCTTTQWATNPDGSKNLDAYKKITSCSAANLKGVFKPDAQKYCPASPSGIHDPCACSSVSIQDGGSTIKYDGCSAEIASHILTGVTSSMSPKYCKPLIDQSKGTAKTCDCNLGTHWSDEANPEQYIQSCTAKGTFKLTDQNSIKTYCPKCISGDCKSCACKEAATDKDGTVTYTKDTCGFPEIGSRIVHNVNAALYPKCNDLCKAHAPGKFISGLCTCQLLPWHFSDQSYTNDDIDKCTTFSVAGNFTPPEDQWLSLCKDQCKDFDTCKSCTCKTYNWDGTAGTYGQCMGVTDPHRTLDHTDSTQSNVCKGYCQTLLTNNNATSSSWLGGCNKCEMQPRHFADDPDAYNYITNKCENFTFQALDEGFSVPPRQFCPTCTGETPCEKCLCKSGKLTNGSIAFSSCTATHKAIPVTLSYTINFAFTQNPGKNTFGVQGMGSGQSCGNQAANGSVLGPNPDTLSGSVDSGKLDNAPTLELKPPAQKCVNITGGTSNIGQHFEVNGSYANNNIQITINPDGADSFTYSGTPGSFNVGSVTYHADSCTATTEEQRSNKQIVTFNCKYQ